MSGAARTAGRSSAPVFGAPSPLTSQQGRQLAESGESWLLRALPGPVLQVHLDCRHAPRRVDSGEGPNLRHTRRQPNVVGHRRHDFTTLCLSASPTFGQPPNVATCFPSTRRNDGARLAASSWCVPGAYFMGPLIDGPLLAFPRAKDAFLNTRSPFRVDPVGFSWLLV